MEDEPVLDAPQTFDEFYLKEFPDATPQTVACAGSIAIGGCEHPDGAGIVLSAREGYENPHTRRMVIDGLQGAATFRRLAGGDIDSLSATKAGLNSITVKDKDGNVLAKRKAADVDETGKDYQLVKLEPETTSAQSIFDNTARQQVVEKK